MMYVEDCLRALHEFMAAPEEMLKRRTYNVTAMSFTPEELVAKLAPHIPELRVTYKPDSRQEIGKYLGYLINANFEINLSKSFLIDIF